MKIRFFPSLKFGFARVCLKSLEGTFVPTVVVTQLKHMLSADVLTCGSVGGPTPTLPSCLSIVAFHIETFVFRLYFSVFIYHICIQ